MLKPVNPFNRIHLLSGLACLVLSLALFSSTGHAQESLQDERPEPAHWAFASIIGTGWYELDGGRSAFILTATPRQHIHEAGFTDSGEREMGFYINYDAAIGVFDLDIPELIDSDNFSTVSFTPGLGLEIPVTPDWYLRAFGNVGWGTSIGDGTSAWIYYAGLKSRFRFGGPDKNWSLLNGLFYAGINPDGGQAQSVSGLFTGLEFSHSIPAARENASNFRLHWQLGYTLIEDQVRVATQGQSYQSIGNTAEIGVAISRPERPFSFWFMEFDRVGATYSVDSRGNFEALTLNFTSWFDK